MQASNPQNSSGPQQASGTQKSQVTSYSVKNDGTVTSLGRQTKELKVPATPPNNAAKAPASK